ncbi:MAG: wax ester/triacylglycerol synthase family O-acyltransferase [Xanthomonadales bacterium]|nr:wax ester/triacylglycerol synthase family O-acyltransferase [Xanthomonadales bacterium]
MRQLSGLDSSFLFTETSNAPMHVGNVGIYDPSTAPDGKVTLERIISTLNERAHLAPALRERLVEVPFNADFPYWVKEKSYDPELHIHHMALPQPGDWKQFCIQVARIHARPLDRSRPLWELHLIEGLDNIDGIPPGCFALVSKTHHAAVDGASNADTGLALCDPTPEIRKMDAEEEWVADRPPTAIELSMLAHANNLTRPQRYLEYLQESISSLRKAQELLSERDRTAFNKIPRTRFNKVVSRNRVFDGVSFRLDEIKRIKRLAEGTVNDVVLAICAGAMRRYLIDKNELPEETLVSMCPISLRNAVTGSESANQVSSMAIPLHTTIESPTERLTAIIRSTTEAKELSRAVSANTLVDAANFISTQLFVAGARAAAEQGMANFVSPFANTVITNVPGSPVPFYNNGALFVRGWGLGPPADGNGLFHSVGSYCDELVISICSCRDMMPDPEFYAECLKQSMSELLEAFDLSEPGALIEATAKPAPATSSKPKKTVKKTVRKKISTRVSKKKTVRKKTASKVTKKKTARKKKSTKAAKK